MVFLKLASHVLTAEPTWIQTVAPDDTNPQGQSAVDYYFIQDDGGMFKSTICYEPYFYIACRASLTIEAQSALILTDHLIAAIQKGHEGNVEEWIMRKYEDLVVRVQRHRKEDLQLVSAYMDHRFFVSNAN